MDAANGNAGKKIEKGKGIEYLTLLFFFPSPISE